MTAKTSNKPELVVSLFGMIQSIINDLSKFVKERGADLGECICHLANPKGEKTLRLIANFLVSEMRGRHQTLDELVDTADGLGLRHLKDVSRYLESIWYVLIDSREYYERIGRSYAPYGSAQRIKIDPRIVLDEEAPRRDARKRVFIELFRLCDNDGGLNSDESALRKIEEDNLRLAGLGAGYRYRFATIEELLSLDNDFPFLRQQYTLAIYGQIETDEGFSSGFICLNYPHGQEDDFRLTIERHGYAFSGKWRYVVVREPLAE